LNAPVSKTGMGFQSIGGSNPPLSAVHVVVFPHGVPVEIQVRTRWQLEWADLLDAVERGTSEDPDDPELSARRAQARTSLAELRGALAQSETEEARINNAREAKRPPQPGI
jgi:ppGpp synthetase/RelA/SpoT-type nucleotidyltranferase